MSHNPCFDYCTKKEYKKKHCKMEKKKILKDCICCDWTVPEGETQTVFQTKGFKKIFGSGYISLDCEQLPYIFVTFFQDDHQVGAPIKVFKDSCVAFLYTKFNRIKVTCPNLGGSANQICEGTICITTRIPVKM